MNVCYLDTSTYLMYSHSLAYLYRWFAQAFVTPHEVHTQRWTFHKRHFTKYEFPQLNCSFWKNSHFSVSPVLISHSHKSFNHRINNTIAILCIWSHICAHIHQWHLPPNSFPFSRTVTYNYNFQHKNTRVIDLHIVMKPTRA